MVELHIDSSRFDPPGEPDESDDSAEDKDMLSNEITIRAKRENLPLVMEFAENIMEKTDCPFNLQMQLSLAIEEIFINIASYAYEPGEGDVHITAEADEHSISFTFADSGIPYDPLSKEDPDVTAPIEERAIGGLGVFLVKQYMDEETYEYKDGQNILKITRFF